MDADDLLRDYPESVRTRLASDPSVRGTASRPADKNGWCNPWFDIALSGADAAIGMSSCPSSTYRRPGGRSVTVPGSCTDVAGTSASPTFGPFTYDPTPATTTIDGAPAQVITARRPLTGRANDNFSGDGVTTVRFAPPAGSAVVREETCTSGCGTLSAIWSVETGGLLGLYTVTAAGTDVAGNPGTTSNSVTLMAA